MNWTKESNLFSRKSAEKEFEVGLNETYKITTIKWGCFDHELTGNIDRKNVQKNIYKMPLSEFISDWMEHFVGHPDEDILKIERLK